MGKNRLVTMALAASLVVLTLSSCSAEERPGPEEAVTSLAEGLSRLDVAGNDFAGSTVEAVNGMLAHVVSGMNLKPTVTAGDIEEVSGNEARATLNYVWDVNASAEDYSYSTAVTLERGPDSDWETRFRSTTIHPDLQPGQRLVREAAPLPRADILGAGGSVLVRHWPVWRVGLDKSVLLEQEYASSAGYLSLFLGLDTDAYTAQVLGAGPKAFVEAVTIRQDKVPADFEKDVATVPGAAALPERRILAPTPTFASALLGSVEQASEEMAATADVPMAPGDLVGTSGLQARYDSMLRGADGVTVRFTDQENTRSEPLFTADAVPGRPLETTLDARIQTLAETVLADQPAGAALVAIQPSTGHVLAVANHQQDKGSQPALLGEFSLEQDFGPAALLAGLRGGDPEDTAGAEEYSAAARSLGLGEDAPLGTPAFSGTVTDQATGQTDPPVLVVSPFALATAAASVARGERVVPSLVLNAADAPEGKAEDAASSDPEKSGGPEPLTAAEARELRSLMRDGAAETLPLAPAGSLLALSGTAVSAGETPRPQAWAAAVQGDVAVALLVPGTDADSAAPALQAFLLGLEG